MTDEDEVKFADFLLKLNQLILNKARLTDELIKFYFEILKDLPFERIVENVILHIREKGNTWFPDIRVFRGNQADEREVEAIHAWERINDYIDRFWGWGLGPSCMKVIRDKMEKQDELHLFPLLQKWGPEIVNGGAIQATRKHFIEAYKAEKVIEERRRLEGAKAPEALRAVAEKLLKGKT